MANPIPRRCSIWIRLKFPVIVSLILVAGCSADLDLTPARLNDLNAEGAKTSLNPAFDPEIFRYSIIAKDLQGAVNLTPFADPSVTISIDGRIISSGVTESISTLVPGDTVLIEVERRTSVAVFFAVYEVVYLPSDFPELNVTVLEAGVSPDPLYVSLNGGNSSYVAILNNHGVPTFFRKEEQRVSDFKWHAATGERSYAQFIDSRNQFGRRNSERVLLDSQFNEIERVTTVGLSHTDQHDFLILPNNELMLLAYDGSLRDLTNYGLTSQELVEDSVIQIIDRATRIVLFEWNSWDQIPFGDQTYTSRSNVREYAHVNSMIVDSDNNIIMSARGASQVVKVSRPGGQILWKLGGKDNQFRFINDPFSHLCGQHTVTRLENGNLLLFDNGQNCWPVDPSRGELTRVVEYRVDEQLMEAELVWSYSQDDTYTTSQGSAQRLPNGNTLIGWGRGPSIFATEVTSDGFKVFEMVASQDGRPVITYRASRYPE